MKPERIILKQARGILAKGNMPSAVCVTAVLGIAIMLCIYMADLVVCALDFAAKLVGITIIEDSVILYYALCIILSSGFLLFALPLFLGAVRFFYNMAKTEDAVFSDLFHYLSFNRYFKAFGIMLKILCRCLWQAALSFMPGVLIFITAAAESIGKEQLDFYNILWYAISYAMIIGGIILFSFLTADKFLAAYICTEYKELGGFFLAVVLSQVGMKGYEKSVHRIMLLHLPLLLLCLLVIPSLFILPYIMTSYAVSAKWLIQLQQKQNNKDE